MSSIAAIDPRCFVPPTHVRPTPRARLDAPLPPTFVLSWRPPMERVKARG